MIDRSQVDNVRRLRNELIDRVLDAERLVQLARHRVERTVRRLVDGRARGRGVMLTRQPEPRVLPRHAPDGLVGAVLDLFDLELARGPGMERIVLEDLEHGHDDVRPLAQNAQGFFRTALEHALRARVAHAVHHVARHPERHAFRDSQQLSLEARDERRIDHRERGCLPGQTRSLDRCARPLPSRCPSECWIRVGRLDPTRAPRSTWSRRSVCSLVASRTRRWAICASR